MGRESSSIELEFGDIENWQADSEVGNYLANRISGGECRDAARPEDCDVFKTVCGNGYPENKIPIQEGTPGGEVRCWFRKRSNEAF